MPEQSSKPAYKVRYRNRFVWSPGPGMRQDQSEWQVVGPRGVVVGRFDHEHVALADAAERNQ